MYHIKSKVWSNLFLLIPLVISMIYQLFFYSILIFFVMIFSILYHYSNEKKFSLIDKIFAHLLIVYNLYVCYLSNFKLPYFLFAIIFVLIGFYFFFIKKKDDYEWHISCAFITLFCLLSYITI